jgi:hypothetical protein
VPGIIAEFFFLSLSSSNWLTAAIRSFSHVDTCLDTELIMKFGRRFVKLRRSRPKRFSVLQKLTLASTAFLGTRCPSGLPLISTIRV